MEGKSCTFLIKAAAAAAAAASSANPPYANPTILLRKSITCTLSVMITMLTCEGRITSHNSSSQRTRSAGVAPCLQQRVTRGLRVEGGGTEELNGSLHVVFVAEVSKTRIALRHYLTLCVI